MRAFKVRKFAKKFLGSMIRIWYESPVLDSLETQPKR